MAAKADLEERFQKIEAALDTIIAYLRPEGGDHGSPSPSEPKPRLRLVRGGRRLREGLELTPRERALTEPPCAFCKIAIGDMRWTCRGCDTVFHVECFWGRIATLDEWITYIRRVMETEDDFEADVVCAACRQREGRGK